MKQRRRREEGYDNIWRRAAAAAWLQAERKLACLKAEAADETIQ